EPPDDTSPTRRRGDPPPARRACVVIPPAPTAIGLPAGRRSRYDLRRNPPVRRPFPDPTGAPMLSESQPPAPPQPAEPPAPLSLYERRVLGVFVEKAKTTPDAYPLSVNALVTGCNQKSNRDPLLNLTDLDVEETLVGLQKKGLAIKLTGGRVIRWRHALYE